MFLRAMSRATEAAPQGFQTMAASHWIVPAELAVSIFVTSFPLGTTTHQTTSNSFTGQDSYRESHLVTDLMIGRDLGVGANGPELLIGLRIADLSGSGQAELSSQSTTSTTSITTFYAPSLISFGLHGTAAPPIGTTTTSTTSSSSLSTYASWNSRFFGVGPRVAVAGSVPIMGSWSFDYSGGVAVLIGDTTFNVSMWNTAGTAFAANYGGLNAVFNTDGFTALSYRFTPNFKVSAGIRADFYNAALTTYSVSTGGLQSLSRVYWGPFVRLTGSF